MTVRIRYAIYDAAGRKLGSFRSLQEARQAVPPSERHLYKFLPETYTRQ